MVQAGEDQGGPLRGVNLPSRRMGLEPAVFELKRLTRGQDLLRLRFFCLKAERRRREAEQRAERAS